MFCLINSFQKKKVFRPTQLARRFYATMSNPKVYFDIAIGEQQAGRITFELYAQDVPKTGL